MNEELNYVQNKNEALEKDHIALVKEVADKPLDEPKMAIQEYTINGFNIIELASVIYGLSRSKRKSLDCS